MAAVFADRNVAEQFGHVAFARLPGRRTQEYPHLGQRTFRLGLREPTTNE